MPHLLMNFIAVGIGIVAGVIQWRAWVWNEDQVKPFSDHLAELRVHLMAASLVGIAVSAVLAWTQNQIDLFGIHAIEFGAAWTVTVTWFAWRTLRDPRAD